MGIQSRLFVYVTLAASTAIAQPPGDIYFGEDEGLGNGSVHLETFPNASAANASFLSTVQNVRTIDFESTPSGTVPVFSIDTQDMSLLFSGYGQVWPQPTGTYGGVYPVSGDQLYFVNNLTAPFTIEFSQSIEAVGFYVTDLGNLGAQVNVVIDGTQEYLIPACYRYCEGGSALFWGISRPDSPFTTVTLNPLNVFSDGWGVDDITFGWVETEPVVASGFWADIGDGPLQTDYNLFPASTSATQVFETELGIDNLSTVSLYCQAEGDVSWRDRGVLTGGPLLERSDLLRDFAFATPLRARIEGLLPGRYVIRTYHHDTAYGNHGSIDITVKDSRGSTEVVSDLVQTTGYAPDIVAIASFEILTDGGDPVVVEFTVVPGTGNVAVLNGIQIEAVDGPIPTEERSWGSVKAMFR